MNTFGRMFRVTTWGESHGRAVGAVVDGCPSGLELDEEDINRELRKRRPGFSILTSGRREEDRVEIMSGVFEGLTLGTPISMIIHNRDVDSAPYMEIKDIIRPGHADLTYLEKFGIRDWRGGGRSSARETAGRVAGGAIARKLISLHGVEVLAHAIEIGGVRSRADYADFEGLKSTVERSEIRCGDPHAEKEMIEKILNAKKEGDSVGGVVEVIVRNPPPGIGEPVFLKLDAYLALGAMTVGAVKGVEFGDGFELARKRGSEANDEPYLQKGRVRFRTNRAGGILGGISTGEDIIMRVAVKPTPSISKPQKTVNIKTLKEEEIQVRGRHDPCIVPRIVPVLEAMTSIVIADCMMLQGLIPRKLK